MSKYCEGAELYMARIESALDVAASLKKISMAQLVPGFSCREIWPYDDGMVALLPPISQTAK